MGSIDEVARRHGIRRATLGWWCWQLRCDKATKRGAVQLVPVHVRDPSGRVESVDDVIEIAVRGALARVGRDPSYIAELAAVLASRC